MSDQPRHPEQKVSPTDGEQLASLIDGRLSAEDRTALLERVAHSPELVEVLADATAAIAHLDGAVPSTGQADVRERPAPRALGRRNDWRRYVLLAASLAAIIVVPFVVRQRSQAAGDPTERLVASLDRRTVVMPEGWPERPWSAIRGAADVLADRARSVRLGVLAADLETLLDSRHDMTATLAEEMATLLADSPAGAPAVAMLRAGAREIRDGVASGPTTVRSGIRMARETVDQDGYQLGAWLETSRIAAARHDSAFFQSRDRELIRQRLARSPNQSPDMIAALRNDVSLPDTPARWRELEERLAALVRSAAR
jgi:hypothetical protein